MLALFDRERTGEGQWVHTSLLEAQIFMLDFQASRWLMKGEVAKQAGNDHPTGIPTGVFPTSDGHINIAAVRRRMFGSASARRSASRSWLDHPEYATADAALARTARRSTSASARSPRPSRRRTGSRLLNKAGVPCGPINTIDQIFAEPQVKHLGIARPVKHPKLGDIKVVGQPINLSDAPQPKELQARRPSSASTPTRCWRAWATTARRSTRSRPAASSEMPR